SAEVRPFALWRRTRCVHDGAVLGRPPETAVCSGSSRGAGHDRSGRCRSWLVNLVPDGCPTTARNPSSSKATATSFAGVRLPVAASRDGRTRSDVRVKGNRSAPPVSVTPVLTYPDVPAAVE